MLNRYGISLPQEETERVDTLRYTWDKLLSLAVSNCSYILLMLTINHLQSEVQTHLLQIQSKFRTTLVTNVTEFKLSVEEFTSNYAEVSVLLLITITTVTHNRVVQWWWVFPLVKPVVV